VTLTAKAEEGSKFTGWSGGGCASSGTGPCKMTLLFVYPAIYPCICLPPTVFVTATFELESRPSLDLTVSKTGTGSGTVASSPSGINCGGACTAGFEEGSTVELTAAADPGSEFREWTGACSGASVTCEVAMSEAKSVSARFAVEQTKLLTLVKSGAGSVKSKPKGISCGTWCSSSTAQFYKDATVLLAAKAPTGGALEGWEGCDSSTNTGLEGTCTVAMGETHNVKAMFKPAAQPLVNPQTLTLTKAGSGTGTVKGMWLSCEAACAATEVAYPGAVTEPKAKAAATVTLLAAPTLGSGFAGWEGCDSEPEGKCVVSMDDAREVTARFEAKPAMPLTLVKSGAGSVKSKPKGISCGTWCSSSTAQFYKDATVLLAAKAPTGGALEGWEGCDSSTNTGLEGTCTVAMGETHNVKAMFKPAAQPLVNPQTLTLTKAGSGTGTVKGMWLSCEAACAATEVAYPGAVTEPKAKAAATVTLLAAPTLGSGFAGWEGCDSEPEGKCVVSMDDAREVTAKFE